MSEDFSRMPTRRRFLGVTGAALAGAAMVPLAQAQQTRSNDHNQPNEEQPGENNTALDAENPSSVWSP
jgi:oxalate decarboxylase